MVEKMMICLFVLTEFTKVVDIWTHRQTDRQTPHDDIDRASIASRGKNGYVYASHDQQAPLYLRGPKGAIQIRYYYYYYCYYYYYYYYNIYGVPLKM